MKTLLFLDDYRDPFDKEIDWMVFSPIGRDVNIVWVKSYKAFCDYIKYKGLPDAICFDHDLGEDENSIRISKGMNKKQSRKLKQLEKTGYDCAKYLVDYCMDNEKPLPLYNIQSANPTGKQNIDMLLKNYINYVEGK